MSYKPKTPLSFCPFCGARQPKELGEGKTFWIECSNPLCGACGPVQESLYLARKAWDIRVELNSKGTNVVYEPVIYEPEPGSLFRKRVP